MLGQYRQIDAKEDSMEQVQAVKTGVNVYYNATIQNNSLQVNPLKNPIPAKFSEVRAGNNIFDGPPSEWMLSIVRFDIPTQLIPIQIFPTEPNPAWAPPPAIPPDPLDPDDINYSPYTVTLTFGAFASQKHLRWIPQDDTVPVPPPHAPVALRQLDYVAYYSLYSYERFCNMINIALAECVVALNSIAGNPIPAGQFPFVTYDGNTLKFTLYVPLRFLDSNAFPIGMYFNGDLNSNFTNTWEQVTEAHNDLIGRDFRFVIRDKVGTNRTTIMPTTNPANNYPGYFFEQEFIALSLLNSFQSIVVTSGSIPVPNEWQALDSDSPNLQNQFLAVLTDFHVQYISGVELRNFVQYLPTAEYRRLSMTSEEEIKNVILNFYWRPKNLPRLIPVLVPFYGVVTAKLLFEKK